MGFNILYISGGDKAYAGQIIRYHVSILPGIKVHWVTEITQVKEPLYFIDEQRFGPYSFWHHQHFLKEIPGGVEMRDIVHYGLPLGILGSIANSLIVKKQLKTIFDYRHKKLEAIFGKIKST